MSYKKMHAFGLDISDSSVALVLLGGNRQVKLCLREQLPFGVITGWKIKDKQFLTDIFLKLKERSGAALTTENAILSFPENKVFAHLFTVPTALANDAKVILRYAQEQIPLNLNESIFDYKILDNGNKNEKRIFFAAVEQKLVFDYLDIFNNVKFKPVAIDLETNSLARAANAQTLKTPRSSFFWKVKKILKKEKIINGGEDIKVVVSIGAKFTVATIFGKKKFYPSISIPVAGQKFTEIILETLQCKNFDEAEKIKKKLTLRSKEYAWLKNDFEASMEIIINEVKSLIAYFEKNNDVQITTLYLSGGGSRLVNLQEYFKASFEVPVEKLKFATQENSADFDVDFYLNAFGLALRWISADPVSEDLNLLPWPQRKLLVEQQTKNVIIYSSLVILFISSLLIASFNIVLSNLYFDLDGLEKTNASFQKIVEGKRYQEIQTHLKSLNDNIQLAKQTMGETYSVRELYNYFLADLPQAVAISHFEYKNDEKAQKHLLNLNGFALTREKVLETENNLKKTPFCTNINAPLSNYLSQKNIFFMFSFEVDLKKFRDYLTEQAEIKKRQEAQAKAKNQQTKNWTSGKTTSSVSKSDSGKTLSTSTAAGKNWEQKQAPLADKSGAGQKVLTQSGETIGQKNLENLQEDLSSLSGNLQGSEPTEETSINDVLHGAPEEYPFKEKIHEKVGDVFVVEEQFSASGSQAKTETGSQK